MFYVWPLPRREAHRMLYASYEAAHSGAALLAKAEQCDVEIDDPCGRHVATVLEPAETGAKPVTLTLED